MLSRAAGWPEDPQEIDNDSGDDGSDGVVIEQDGSQEDDSSPNDDVLEDWAQNDDEGSYVTSLLPYFITRGTGYEFL